MTAKFEDTRVYAGPKERIFQACVKAARLSELKITVSDPVSGRISAISSDSQFSSRPDSGFLEEVGLLVADLAGFLSKFKERITVTIDDEGNVHALSVSEPRTIRLDQDRNRQHILKLWAALDMTLGREGISAKPVKDNGITITDTRPMQDASPYRRSPDKPSGIARCAGSAASTGSVSAAHAFISYVREDAGKVDALQRTLEAAGVQVWRDTSDLRPGEDWRARIRDAITDNALVFIACFSRHSAVRGESNQNEELVLAIEQLRRRKPDMPWLIPVRFDDCAIPDFDIGAGRTLASLRRADVFGDRRDEAVSRLIEAVLRSLTPGQG
jgi:hypothetical protein